MPKPYHNLKVALFAVFYIIVNLSFLPIGNLIGDIPFAFGMAQFTILAILVSLKYEMFAGEIKKIAKKPMMHLTLLFVCCILYSIVAMIAYLGLLGTSLIVSINPAALSVAMFIAQSLMILLALPVNDVFFVKLMQSLNYKSNEQIRSMIGLAVFVFVRSLLFFVANPASVVATISYTMITGFCAVMLMYKNISVMMYPLGVLAISILFAFL